MTAKLHPLAVNTEHFYVLAPIAPFVDIGLRFSDISRREFDKIVKRTADYQNDPRLIEMVRRAGDDSAKVPYLLEADETPDSILATLRAIAQPHVDYLRGLPGPVQTTIHLLLSINTVPRGCEQYGLPALLEIDRIQGEFVKALSARMTGRQLAQKFHADNRAALQQLDQDWPRLLAEHSSQWTHALPEQTRMHFRPYFDPNDRLVYLHETCVIVDAPDAPLLRKFVPPVLQHPRPANVPVPETGSADWLIREVGKIGRHFTRALLGIIKAHLAAERVALEPSNYELINQHAQEALQEFVASNP
jgi:hypothetical protein